MAAEPSVSKFPLGIVWYSEKELPSAAAEDFLELVKEEPDPTRIVPRVFPTQSRTAVLVLLLSHKDSGHVAALHIGTSSDDRVLWSLPAGKREFAKSATVDDTMLWDCAVDGLGISGEVHAELYESTYSFARVNEVEYFFLYNPRLALRVFGTLREQGVRVSFRCIHPAIKWFFQNCVDARAEAQERFRASKEIASATTSASASTE